MFQVVFFFMVCLSGIGSDALWWILLTLLPILCIHLILGKLINPILCICIHIYIYPILSSCAQVLTQYLETAAADQVSARPVPTPARQEGHAGVAAGDSQYAEGNEFNTFPYPDRLPDSPYAAPTLSDRTTPEPTPPQKSPVTPARPISTVQSDGSVASQPLVAPASASQMAAGLPDASEVWGPDGQPIPEIGDESAPKPRLGEHHISPEAIRQRAKRVFTPRADGSLKVSQKIFDEWKGRGKARKNLEEIFKQCGYDVDPRMQSGFAIFDSVSIWNSLDGLFLHWEF